MRSCQVKKARVIFETAMRLFASQGYEATTTLQVARAVGITEPSVFYHFKNKVVLYAAVLEAAAGNYLQRIDTLQGDDRTAFGALEALIQAHFALVEQEPAYAQILLRACPARLKDTENGCAAIFGNVQSRLKGATTAILEKGVATKEFRHIDIEATANTLLALLNGLMMHQIDEKGRIEGDQATAVDFCRSGLGIIKRRHSTKIAKGN